MEEDEPQHATWTRLAKTVRDNDLPPSTTLVRAGSSLTTPQVLAAYTTQ